MSEVVPEWQEKQDDLLHSEVKHSSAPFTPPIRLTALHTSAI